MSNLPFINTLVVKVASRCNLNCTYCYMYNRGDTTYLKQPKVMSNSTIDHLIKKILLHCRKHKLEEFTIVLHGGEPLLAGMNKIKYFVDSARFQSKSRNIKLNFTMQTNALLLTKEWCELLTELNVRLGISLDGKKEIHDKYRIDHAGKGSYDKTIEKLTLANKYYTLRTPGILSVIDINLDPKEAIDHLVEIGAKSVDFLLPASNHDDLPPKPTSGPFINSPHPYGDWYVRLYDHLKTIPNEKRPIVKLFHNLISNFLGAKMLSDIIGDEENHVLVIETNGDIESIDMLKICGQGFTKDQFNVSKNSLDDAFDSILSSIYYNSHSNICTQCANCPILSLCGSGFIVHRYSKANGFNNPTIYCKDYVKFITHIQNDIIHSLPEAFNNTEIVQSISYEEVMEEIIN